MNVLPPELLLSLKNVTGFNEESFIKVHESGEQITSIRKNPAKQFDVDNHFNNTEKVTWSSNGFYLKERPSFTIDPLFHAGAYYVQEASSMFLEEVFVQTCDLTTNLRVLDLCASPGGKSSLIQSIISADSLLVSNEVIKTRVNALVENITKWGAANVIITNNDAKDFERLPSFFDVVVVDAPCSGSGLFRKDNNAINEWSVNNVALCSQRQERIIADVLTALKPGGLLIYSTCSYSESEDELIADKLVSNFDMKNIALDIDKFANIVTSTSAKTASVGYRFFPDKIKGEGFYIAVFRKNGEPEIIEKRIKYKDIEVSKSALISITPYIKNADNFSFIQQKEEVLAVPKALLHSLCEVQFALYIKKAGINVGTLIRNELIPAHNLAMSNIVSDIFFKVELSLESCLEYLRKKEISIDTDKKGWALVMYKNHSLGFVKILPGRVNNYYPKELRILNK